MNLDATPPTVSTHSTVALDGNGKVFVQQHPKTDTSNRQLKVPQFAVDVLVRRRIESHYDWVFPSATGTLRFPHNLRRNWREAGAGTPYANVAPRSLRKTVATLLKNRLGAEFAKDQLGHSTDSVTRKHYIHLLHEGPDATSTLAMFAENSE